MTTIASVAPRIRAIDLPPFDPLNTRAAELRAAGKPVISLGQALPFFSPPDSILAAARAALDRRDIHGYSTDPGLVTLRQALAARLSSVGIDAVADDLIITAGANHAFTLALMTLVDPGDEVVLPGPFFTNHEMAVRALGAVSIEAPVADRETFSIGWRDIEPHLTNRTKAVVLCTPSNPTGAAIDPAAGALLVSELQRRGIVVISDETYMQFVYGRRHWSAASTRGWRGHVAVVGTFSKSFAVMGWRVGFMLADAAVCREAVKIQDAMIICAPVISQVAVEAAVRDDWHYAESFHGAFLERRQALIDGLAAIPRVSWTPTSAAFFGLVRVEGCTDSAALARALLEEVHVVSIPGSAFGRSGEGHLRLSYGSTTVEAVREATERLARFFRAHPAMP
jgi:aminotransferase